MINNSILNMENQRKYISIHNIFRIILILSLFLSLINNCLANNEDSKKCVVYRDGKLIYNPDNPKIHCTTLQILDNFWDDNNTNIPNSNKKSEDFTEILTLKDIKSNGNTVCKNPSTSNATFTAKDALEGETISGTCNTGYTGTVSATCQEDGSWSINNNCFSDCNDLENMYADSSFINTIKTISNDEFAYSKCDIGYDGYKKHKCENGKIETTNVCSIIKCNDLVNMYKENTFANKTTSVNHGELAYEKCDVGYGGYKEYTCNAGTIKILNEVCEILSGCTEFSVTGEEEYFEVPTNGFKNLKVQVWGAQGGISGPNRVGGTGGYGYGELLAVPASTKIHIIVGQHGGTTTAKNWNPFGAGYGGEIGVRCTINNGGYYASPGGGGTKVWFDDNILQVGGGGGSGPGGSGGAGGGANNAGSEIIINGTIVTGRAGTKNNAGNGCGDSDDGASENEDGGRGFCGGGGGGGWYGGGGCNTKLSGGYYGGGGGSGYSKGFINTIGENGIKTGDGFVRICWGDNTSCDGTSATFSPKCN